MEYPKALMSITELVKMGYSREDLKRAANHILADKYTIRTSGGGKILFDTQEWEKKKRFVLRSK